jgi:hypothetical protein
LPLPKNILTSSFPFPFHLSPVFFEPTPHRNQRENMDQDIRFFPSSPPTELHRDQFRDPLTPSFLPVLPTLPSVEETQSCDDSPWGSNRRRGWRKCPGRCGKGLGLKGRRDPLARPWKEGRREGKM